MKYRGFTLIEILVVLAIVAILAAAAVPGYGQYIGKSKIRTVQGDLQTLALLFEQRYQRVLSFPVDDLANTVAVQEMFDSFAPASAAAEVMFSSTDSGLTQYTVIATGKSSHLNGCTFSLTHTGTKTITGCSTDAYNGEWL